MDSLFQGILFGQESEDKAMLRSEGDLMNAIRGEFSNAEALIAEARERGFSLSDFFSGAPLPPDLELPVRRSNSFYVKKHTAVQQPYLHAHEFFELIYVQTGHCLQTLQDGGCIRLKKGQCCLLRPGSAHRIERIRPGDVILKVVIPCDLFARCIDAIPLPEEGVIVFGQMSLFAEYLFLRLLKESHIRGIYSRTAVSALLSLLFCELARGKMGEGGGSRPVVRRLFPDPTQTGVAHPFRPDIRLYPRLCKQIGKTADGQNVFGAFAGISPEAGGGTVVLLRHEHRGYRP